VFYRSHHLQKPYFTWLRPHMNELFFHIFSQKYNSSSSFWYFPHPISIMEPTTLTFSFCIYAWSLERDLDWRSYSNDFIRTMVLQFLNDNLTFRLSFILFGWISLWAFCFIHCRSSPAPRHVSQELKFPRFLYRIISHIRFLDSRKLKKKTKAVVIDWQCDWFMNDNLEIWIPSGNHSSNII